MLAAVTTAPNVIEVMHRPEPAPPRPGHVLLRPETVGICGSDFHIFTGDDALSGAQRAYPRVQGHEISATVVAAGADCPPELSAGGRVAVWPLLACGRCYPCRVDRSSCCVDFQLIGVHIDGGLQELLTVPATQAFAAGDAAPQVVAFAEPLSVAVHAVRRGRVAAGEHVAVLGAGPIGQAAALAAADAGARVMVIDPLTPRRELALLSGAEAAAWGSRDDIAARVRDWSGGGPQVVMDTTGDPAALEQALDMVISAGRVVVVGMSGGAAPVRSGLLPVKEIDVLGSSCCDAADFAAAVALVRRSAAAVARLVTDEFPLAEAAAAITRAMNRPEEVMKVTVATGGQRPTAERRG
ncbi:MAG TPA: alcohol dehydrogenase catalytic domain-containing protein [Streptosporangiaceae bacterium]|nr:alcohol dehydrogenase catalytic domain-containing protein [Streptosporangiaceae bacterium]